MGSIYAQRILGIESPRVGLMNVGGEEAKGTADLEFARDMLRDAEATNFIGYVEGRGVFDGEADVVVTDGVVGNVMIKLAEGLSAGIFKAIASEVFEIDPELAMRFEPVVKSLYSKHDYHEYGGAPLLGVNGVCMIVHGSAVGRTITNAILRGREFVLSGVNQAITESLATVGQDRRQQRARERNQDMNHADLTAGFNRGVRIAGTGSAVPDGILTNDDLARMVDTSDEWIQQRTGIKERRICDKPREGTLTLSRARRPPGT